MAQFMAQEVLSDYWRHQLYNFASSDSEYAILWKNVTRLPDPARYASLDTFIPRVAKICRVPQEKLDTHAGLSRLLLHTFEQGVMRRQAMERTRSARKERQQRRDDVAEIDKVLREMTDDLNRAE